MVDQFILLSLNHDTKNNVVSSLTNKAYFTAVNVVPFLIQTFIGSGISLVVGLIDNLSQINSGTLVITLIALITAYLASFLPSAMELVKSTMASVRILRFIPPNVINEVASIRNTMKRLAT